MPAGGRAVAARGAVAALCKVSQRKSGVTAQPCFHPGPTAAEAAARRRQRWSPARRSKVSGSATLLAPALCTAPRGTTARRAAPQHAELHHVVPSCAPWCCIKLDGTPGCSAVCCASWHHAVLHGSTWHLITPRGTVLLLVTPWCSAPCHTSRHHAALQGSTRHHTAPRGTVLHFMAARGIAPHLVAPCHTSWHRAALHHAARLRCAALHHVQCSALQLAVPCCTPWHHTALSSSTFMQCVTQHLPQPLTAPCPQPQMSPAGSRCVQQGHGAARFLQVPPGLGGQELGREQRRAVGNGAELRVPWHRGLILPRAAPNELFSSLILPRDGLSPESHPAAAGKSRAKPRGRWLCRVGGAQAAPGVAQGLLCFLGDLAPDPCTLLLMHTAPPGSPAALGHASGPANHRHVIFRAAACRLCAAARCPVHAEVSQEQEADGGGQEDKTPPELQPPARRGLAPCPAPRV